MKGSLCWSDQPIWASFAKETHRFFCSNLVRTEILLFPRDFAVSRSDKKDFWVYFPKEGQPLGIRAAYLGDSDFIVSLGKRLRNLSCRMSRFLSQFPKRAAWSCPSNPHSQGSNYDIWESLLYIHICTYIYVCIHDIWGSLPYIYVCVHIYIYMYVYTWHLRVSTLYMHIYIYTYIHTTRESLYLIYVCMYIYTYVYTWHLRVSTLYTYMYIYICMYTWHLRVSTLHICMYIYIYICMYIYDNWESLLYTYIFTYIHIYTWQVKVSTLYMYIRTYIHIYIHDIWESLPRIHNLLQRVESIVKHCSPWRGLHCVVG